MKRFWISRAIFLVQGFLWVSGVFALGYCAMVLASARLAQGRGNLALEHALAERPSRVIESSTDHREGSLVGRIEIPRLHLSAIVFEGTSDFTLARGVGHMRGSGSPGQPGNIVLAGHRDTFFRELRGIRQGDEIAVTGSRGQFWYRVDALSVVSPDRVEVLRPGSGQRLTLITCYPFNYLGSAPQRYIVRADRTEPKNLPTRITVDARRNSGAGARSPLR